MYRKVAKLDAEDSERKYFEDGQGQRQKQIPFGNDNQKSEGKGKGKCKSGGKGRSGFSAGMTTSY
jgi:hypothetical protein